jgi:hypothetical protein
MSEFDFFGGAEGGDNFAGLFHVDGPEPHGFEPHGFESDDHDWHGLSGFQDHGGFQDHSGADGTDGLDHVAVDSTDDGDAHDAPAYGADGSDGFDVFDLDATGFDNDLTFDASYDLIGHDPDESGWWEVLTSDHNHDGAYEMVSYDTYLDPNVVH